MTRERLVLTRDLASPSKAVAGFSYKQEGGRSLGYAAQLLRADGNAFAHRLVQSS